MAVTIIGEVANTCEVDDFNAGALDNDIFIQGAGSIGQKTSNTTNYFITPTLGASEPYNFSEVTTAESGYHIIMWFNGLTPLNTTTGMKIQIGDGTNDGTWEMAPPAGYTGGFVPRVINTAADFDLVTGAWTTGGNPGQLTAVSEGGGGFTTTTSIMGNFNNVLIDQFSVGSGLRIDAGTAGSPNTWDTIITAESTNVWGWLVESFGALIARGGFFFGPETGNATSVFNDAGAAVTFADERVAGNFYRIDVRGTGTDFDLDNAVVKAESPENAKFSIFVASGVDERPAFDLDGGLYEGFQEINLAQTSSVANITFSSGVSLIQNDAVIDTCTFQNSLTGDGEPIVTSDNPADISDCTFTQSSGHAIEITQTGVYSFTGNTFTGYEGVAGTNGTANSGPTNAAIYNNSGGSVTLNISNGTTPSVRNGASATTTVAATVTLTLDGLETDSEVRVYRAGTTTEEAGTESSTTSFDYAFQASPGFNVDIIVFHLEYLPFSILDFTLPGVNTTLPVSQIFDRNYDNPE